jgi:hypothetical protein
MLTIHELVELFLSECDGRDIGDWRVIGGECSGGGFGLCDHASAEFVDWLWTQGIEAYRAWMTLEDFGFLSAGFDILPHPDYPKLAIGDPTAQHCVVVVEPDGVVVDLTPRQYDENLPFPFIWTPEAAGAEDEEAAR